MKKELISIVIPCYNASEFLDDCLKSILNQTYENIELIIVNDGSTDNSEEIIDSYKKKFDKKKINLIKINQENQGQAVACEEALKHVSGKYLYWQDTDDVLEKDGLEKLHNYLVKHKDCQLVRGKVSYRNEKTFNKTLYIGESKDPKNTNIFDAYLFETDAYCFVGIFMVRMDWFDKCNPNRCLYHSRGGQNYQLLLPITYKGKCGYLDEVVYRYRIRDNSHFHSVTETNKKLERCDIHQKIILETFKLIKFDSFREKFSYIRRIKKKYRDRKKEIKMYS